MPLEVPENPKVYTTVYDNFRGVDFTNDASNVWKHRSPNGLNMLPDLDGRPYKRKGWKIDVSAEDFIEASGVTGTTTVTPYRTYYFEIGGMDYILIFNSIGLFLYDGQELECLTEYIDADGNSQTFPMSFPRLLTDSKRGFFYESGGETGFYFIHNEKMLRLQLDTVGDEQVARLHEITPYVPRMYMGCDPATGAGQNYESANLLSSRCCVSYTCDKNNTVTRYHLPFVIANELWDLGEGLAPEVWVLNNNGTWEQKERGNDKDWIVDSSTYADIVFLNGAPTTGTQGEDNVLVIATRAITAVGNIEVLSSKATPLARNNDGSWGMTSSGNTKYNSIVHTCSMASVESIDQIICWVKQENGFWAWIGNTSLGFDYTIEDLFDISIDAYSGNVTYTAKNEEIWASNLPYTKEEQYITPPKWGFRRTYTFKFQTNLITSTRSEGQDAFFGCSKFAVYGSGLTSQVFATATGKTAYKSRVWYTGLGLGYENITMPSGGLPNYFPELNYVEVGSNDTAVMSTIKCGEYLGIVKQGKTTDTSIYLAYPTSFDNDTTYAVKQSIAGIGAVSNGAFNVLNEEPLFLSEEGVMGIEIGEDNRLRSRSYFINKRLLQEPNLQRAISFVHNTQYWLCVNNHCYVLDGTQKTSWANEKTNLQYECYFLDNIPAQCFAKMDSDLYFTDFRGNLCKFKTNEDSELYTDAYTTNRETGETINYSDINIPLDGSGKPDYEVMQAYIGKAVAFSDADSVDTVVPINKSHSFETIPGSWAEVSWTLPEETRAAYEAHGSIRFCIACTCYDHDSDASARYFGSHYFEYPSTRDMASSTFSVKFASWYGHFILDYRKSTNTFKVRYSGAIAVGGVMWVIDSVVTDHIECPSYSEHTIPQLKTGSLCEVIIRHDNDEYSFEFTEGVEKTQAYILGSEGPSYATQDYYFSITYDGDRTLTLKNMCYGTEPITIVKMACTFNGEDMAGTPRRVASADEEFRRFVFSDYTNVPLTAQWDTIADDDGMVHYFKNLQKKGCVVSLLPDNASGVEVYLIPDEKDSILIGETDVSGNLLPAEYYVKKKVKKYKRLRILCKNDGADQGFGIDQIIKSYTVGNFSKNRR